jgi:hypothetical protein
VSYCYGVEEKCAVRGSVQFNNEIGEYKLDFGSGIQAKKGLMKNCFSVSTR